VNIRLDLLAWTAAAAMAAIPATALAAVDTFIWFEGGQGTSTDARHKGWFEVRDFSFAVEGSAAVGSATGGAGSGKVKAKEFTIKRVSDSASPTFFRQAVSSGRHFPVVKIEMRKAGGDPHQYADYVFTDVLISKINMSGPGDRGPEESITFVYGGMTVQYVNQGASGQTAPAPAKALAPPPPGRSQPPPR
jgi:type VI secretion system secreted protein Hcp